MNARRIQLFAAALLAAAAMAVCAQTPPAKEDPKARLAKAEAMFAERCKKSGEFIKRTVENVEGIYLRKLRPEKLNRGDQFAMDDPYGFDVRGEGLINSFLQGRNKYGSLASEALVSNDYRYVEAIDPKDGKRYRYTGRIDEPWRRDPSYSTTYKRFVLDKVPAPGPSPRYGATYDDISTREEREYWIAGSSLKVMDLKTNEVIAERIGYMVDRGQGSDAGDRAPWLMAANNACPAFPRFPGNPPFQLDQTRRFVESVLHIKQEK